MTISLIAGAGIAIAAAVGPAREWRGAFWVPANVEVVDRSSLLRSEDGVPGSVDVDPSGRETVREHVPLQEQLIKKPAPPTNVQWSQRRFPRAPAAIRSGNEKPIPIVVIRPKPDLEHGLRIPTNTSPVPPLTTQPGDETSIRQDGPSESASPQRLAVKTTPGKDGWNKVEVSKTGFAPSNPDRAKYIDDQVEQAHKMMDGKGPYVLQYRNIDPNDPDSSMTPRKTTVNMDVHDSQMHLFETAGQTQQRLAHAQQQMLGGNANPMQKLFHDIADAGAAAQKMRVYRGPGAYRSNGAGIAAPAYMRSGSLDPRLLDNEKENAAAAELAQLVGVDRYVELLDRNEAEKAIDYLNDYIKDNKEDGRAFAVLGLQQLSKKKSDVGMRNLARACELSTSAFGEPVDIASLGISSSALADTLSSLMARKEQAKGVKEATALAAAAHAIGREEASRKLLDQAVALGMDRSEAATLAACWKLHK